MARSGLVLSFTSGLKARVSDSTGLLWERLLSQPGLSRENTLLSTHLGQHFIFFPFSPLLCYRLLLVQAQWVQEQSQREPGCIRAVKEGWLQVSCVYRDDCF